MGHVLHVDDPKSAIEAPTLKVPVPLLRVLATVMELGAELTGTRPALDRSQVDEFGGRYGYFDSGKAQRELGYTYRPARETVQRTITCAGEPEASSIASWPRLPRRVR